MKSFEEVAKKHADDKYEADRAFKDKEQRRRSLFDEFCSEFNKYAQKFNAQARASIFSDGVNITSQNNNLMTLTFTDDELFNIEVDGPAYPNPSAKLLAEKKGLTIEQAQYEIIGWLDIIHYQA